MPTEILAIVATSALHQRSLAAGRDLRLEHELAELDGLDAVTNLVTLTNPPIHLIPSAAPTSAGSASTTTTRPITPPIHLIPSAAPTAAGSAPATTTRPHHPAHPPHPERSTDGRWLGPRDDHDLNPHRRSKVYDNYPDDNYPDDNYPDDNYPDDNYPDESHQRSTPTTMTTTRRTTKNREQRSETDGEM